MHAFFIRNKFYVFPFYKQKNSGLLPCSLLALGKPTQNTSNARKIQRAFALSILSLLNFLGSKRINNSKRYY